jgi:hypothetical protein
MMGTVTLEILRKEAEQMWKSDLIQKGVSYEEACKQSLGRFDNYNREGLDRYIGVRAYINLKVIQN